MQQAHVWSRELVPALAAEGIVVSRVEELSDAERLELVEIFERDIFPVLTPLAVGPGQPFPYISALSISLAVFARDPETGEERFARVKVPEGLPRFLPVGERGTARPARAGAHRLPAQPLSRDGDPRALAVPGHARRRLRGLRRGRRPARGGRAGAAPRPLRRGDAARGLRLDVAVAARAPAAGTRRRRRSRLPDRRHVRPRRRDGADASRPARPEERSVDPGGAAAARRPRRRSSSSPLSAPATSSYTTRTTRSPPASSRSSTRARPTPT